MRSTSSLSTVLELAALPPEPPDLDRVLAMAQCIDLDQVVLLSQVKSYTRIENGKVELVGGYEHKQGHFVDSLGHQHWGWYGGAGVLPFHVDSAGTVRFMLQKRAGGVQHSGTYSTAGGAIDKLGDGTIETPEQAAARETHEEFGEMPEGVSLAVTKVDSDHHGTPGEPGHWAYHTVYLKSSKMFSPTGKNASHGFESGGYKWVTKEEMAQLPLHPDFGKYAATHLGIAWTPPPPPPPLDTRFRKGDVVTFHHAKLGKVVEATVQGLPEPKYPTYQLQPHVKNHPVIELKPKHILSGPEHPPEPPKPAPAPKAAPPPKVGPIGMPEPREPGELRRHDRVRFQREGKTVTGEIRYVHPDGTVEIREDVPKVYPAAPPKSAPAKAASPPSSYEKGDRVIHRTESGEVKAGSVIGANPGKGKKYPTVYHVKYDSGGEGSHPANRLSPEPSKGVPIPAAQPGYVKSPHGYKVKTGPFEVGDKVHTGNRFGYLRELGVDTTEAGTPVHLMSIGTSQKTMKIPENMLKHRA